MAFPKKLIEKKEPKKEERREAKMPPAAFKKFEKAEGKHFAKGGAAKGKRGC